MSYPVVGIEIVFNNTGSGSVVLKDLTDSDAPWKQEVLHSGVNKPFLNLITFLQEHIEVTPISCKPGQKPKGVWKLNGSLGVQPKPASLVPKPMGYPKLKKKKASVSGAIADWQMWDEKTDVEYLEGIVKPWWKHIPVDADGVFIGSKKCKHSLNKWGKCYMGTWYCTNGQHKPKTKKVKSITDKKLKQLADDKLISQVTLSNYVKYLDSIYLKAQKPKLAPNGTDVTVTYDMWGQPKLTFDHKTEESPDES